MHLRTLFLICSIIISVIELKAQSSWDGVGVEANYFHSNMMRHSKKITAPLAKDTRTFELSLTKKFRGTKDWHLRRNYPEAGIGAFYLDYNNREIYGAVFAIVPHLRFRVIAKEKFSWTLRAGLGIGYVTNPYQRVPKLNLDNETIGGYINNFSPLQTDLRYVINNHLEFQAGAHLLHVSNASFRRPNFGINIWGIHAGLRYFPISNKPEKIERALPELPNRILFYTKASIAFVEKDMPDGGLNRVYNGGIFATKRYLGKNKIILGADYTYNTAVYAAIKYNFRHKGKENRWSSQSSIFLGNEFEFNHFGIVLQAGVYLMRYDQQTDRFYQKLGGNFYWFKRETGLLKEGLCSVLLKTHQNRAELLELGMALGF
jgi:hypothetical protein